ncbi:MAG: LytR/AlgR family response regulator transcription factor [Longibaculum sp.]
MKIGIIDDDQEFAEILEKELQQLFSNPQITIYQNITDEIYKREYDILFLDVLLYDKKSFDQGEQILTTFPATTLVYISSMDNFVFESYKQRTFYFVRKSNLHQDLIQLSKKYNQKEISHKQVLTIQGNINILQCDIIYMNSSKNQIIIYTTYNEYTIYSSLKEIYEQLDKNYFYRFNSYTIMNFRHVIDVREKYVYLTQEKKIVFTRNSKDKFMKAYMEYRRRQIWIG